MDSIIIPSIIDPSQTKEISLYNLEEEECFDFEPIGIDKKWCNLYQKSNYLISNQNYYINTNLIPVLKSK